MAMTKGLQLLDKVVAFSDAGLACIPVRLDGSKHPAIQWGRYIDRRPTFDETRRWFFSNNQSPSVGVAHVCGVVSGGLEVIDFDFDAESVFPRWSKQIESIVSQLPVVETPGGGFHVYYRCQEVCSGKAIAKYPEEKKPVVETRGQGNLITSILSSPEVHSANKPYVQVAGPSLPKVPRISVADRRRLWEAARAFDQTDIKGKAVARVVRRLKQQGKKQIKRDGKLSPWEDYNERGSWSDLLTPHDWSTVDGIYWRHPNANSENGCSATVRQASNGQFVLRMFSTSTTLEADKSHSLFSAFLTLNHNGDVQAAVKELRNAGYGN